MLEINNIVKQYAQHRALDDISLSIKRGTIFGLLGPNGAGKTSLIRIITQITGPDSGSILFNGEHLNPQHIEKIGYLPEERGLYKKMQIGDQMLYLAQLKGLSKEEAKRRIKHWFEKMEMQTWWNKKVEDLSKGMQQKVQFVATVLHQPELLILDEPFSGFDPVNADLIKSEILELHNNGTTIIFSTHRMESVEELCDNIALINKSKKILDGSLVEIKNSYRENKFKIVYHSQEDSIPINYALFIVEYNKRVDHTTTLFIKILEDKTINEILSYLLEKVEIRHVEEIIPSIHDIFVKEVTTNRLN
ncbi:ABC transporter ATP-binding protein [Olivibacter domesticus]|uniref:ABC-2 type transport system ATP-binding protein n=1 Tax=Olivibacter domesticus TaxID=407022 RepID=A0A1H7PKF5_OLID1|nr:ABC transporter ATP-binding protein [Olivibacter domesticus]SEL36086.1 ABC-2 type transport system ATP-binding protein [Olivibacter domesticus]